VPKPERYTGERFYNRVKGFIWFVVIAFAVLYFMSLSGHRSSQEDQATAAATSEPSEPAMSFDDANRELSQCLMPEAQYGPLFILRWRPIYSATIWMRTRIASPSNAPGASVIASPGCFRCIMVRLPLPHHPVSSRWRPPRSKKARAGFGAAASRAGNREKNG
jgi:hypothetical protein